jgi:hypothetical protein
MGSKLCFVVIFERQVGVKAWKEKEHCFEVAPRDLNILEINEPWQKFVRGFISITILNKWE